jgi:hypothetical protein
VSGVCAGECKDFGGYVWEVWEGLGFAHERGELYNAVAFVVSSWGLICLCNLCAH